MNEKPATSSTPLGGKLASASPASEKNMTEQKPKTLHARIVEVMERVEALPKDGHNAFHNYNYVTEDAVANALRPLLAEAGIAFIPSCLETTKDGEFTRVKMQYRFVDIITGEKEEIVFYGEGQDKGDKGLYKAYTGAEKYALTSVFLIGSSEDPEKAAKAAGQPKYAKPSPPSKSTPSMGDEINKRAAKPPETPPAAEQKSPASANSTDRLVRMRQSAEAIKWDILAFVKSRFNRALDELSENELRQVDTALATQTVYRTKNKSSN